MTQASLVVIVVYTKRTFRSINATLLILEYFKIKQGPLNKVHMFDIYSLIYKNCIYVIKLNVVTKSDSSAYIANIAYRWRNPGDPAEIRFVVPAFLNNK